MTTAVATRGNSAKPGQVQSVHIDFASNGYEVETRRKQKPARSNQPYDYEGGMDKKVFNNPADMLAFIASLCPGKKKEKDKAA
jgi:hypothetical protein